MWLLYSVLSKNNHMSRRFRFKSSNQKVVFWHELRDLPQKILQKNKKFIYLFSYIMIFDCVSSGDELQVFDPKRDY